MADYKCLVLEAFKRMSEISVERESICDQVAVTAL